MNNRAERLLSSGAGMRRFLIMLIPAVLILMIFTMGCAGAETEKIFSAACPERSGETVISKKNGTGQYVISLPGFWDITGVTLSLPNREVLYLGTERIPVAAGVPADLSRWVGQKIPVKSEKQDEGTLLILQGSRLPALFLTGDDKELGKVRKNKEYKMTAGQVTFAEADGSISWQGEISHLKGRGNATFGYVKKPYELKLSEKASLAGIPKGKTWILLANYCDISLLRNQIVLDLAREIGLPYAVKCAQTDVWFNGEYQGLYLLTEKVQIKKNRINIRDLEEETEKVNDQPLDSYKKYRKKWEKLSLTRGYLIPENPEDITGGYIGMIEKTHRFRDYVRAGIMTEGGLSVRIKEPTYPSEEQVHYFGALMNDMHLAVMAEDGVNPGTGKRYDEYLDKTSWAAKFLLEDWCKNFDFIAGSQYLFKDTDANDPLIYAGPAWDYDLSFGNMEERGNSPKGSLVTAMNHKNSNLYWLLSKKADFMQKAEEIWKEKFRPALAVLQGEKEPGEDSLIRPYSEYVEAIRDSAEMNYVRWSPGTYTIRRAGGNFTNAVNYLENWIRQRTEYLDNENTLFAQQSH